MEIIADNGAKDITVKFDDGTIVYHQRRESFEKGYIRHPNDTKHKGRQKNPEKHIGETNTDVNGRIMTIIEYYSNSNVTLQYDDGKIIKDKEYRQFKRGIDMYPSDYTGRTVTARNGLKMTVIADRKWNDIDIQFEDGVIIEHCSHNQFDTRAIKHPNINARVKQIKEKRIGETRLLKNGLQGTIVGYENAKDLSIRFENGITVHHKCYSSFEKGTIKMPLQFGKIKLTQFICHTPDDKWLYQVENDGKTDIMSIDEIINYTNNSTDTVE
jgi:hypothetical protein